MNIVVVLRTALDPAGFIVNRKAQKVFVNREQAMLNPADENALEMALALRREGDVLIAAASGGLAETDALRQALALGANRAVLVSQPETADASVAVNLLQRLIDHLNGCDVVLLGHDVVDADLGQVGPRLAEALDMAFVEAAHEVALDNSTLTAVVRRGKAFHRVEADLPAVVSTAAHSNKLRYAPGARIVNVYRDADAVEELSLEDLGLGAGELAPLVERRGESFPPERQLGRQLDGTVEEMAVELGRVIRGL